MKLHEDRKSSLEKTMIKIVGVLGECDQKLIDENDPKARSKLKSQISELKQQLSDCEADISSCEPEQRMHRNLALTMSNITFEDMNFIITALINQKIPTTDNTQDSFQTTNPEAKMSKNNLSSKIKFLLNMGLGQAKEVRHFIENNAKIYFPDIPERIKASLNAGYSDLIKSGIKGDELFIQMYNFSHHNDPDPSRQAAGLAVLCYFFETCDVFEP